MTAITRVSPDLIHIDGLPCKRVAARKATKYHLSRKPIVVGAAVYRPLGNPKIKSARWLAEEIEAMERAR